jgi:YD repeat-containing protein
VGNLQSTVEPDGQTTTYQYDDLNRLALETVTQGSTLVETFDYDQVLVTGTKNPDLMLQADGDRGGEVDTRYNASGGVVSQTTTAWTYDPDDRLTGETLTVQVGAGLASVPAAYTDAFHYDLANNRTEEDIDGGDTTAGGQSIRYVYDADDQLRTETETAYATATTTTQVYQTTYTYAYAGNLWTQTRTGTEAASDTYTYDLRDRMTKAVEAGTETDYGYDTDGVRVSEGSPGGTQTYYVNDPNNPTGYTKAIEEETGASPSTATTSRSYVLGTKVEAQSDATNGTLYLLTDGHGSTRALVNGAGQTVETYAYDAFGTLLAGTHTNTQTNVTTAVTAATAATEWLFGGDGLYDPASGWTYHLARWTNGFWFTTSDFGPTGSGSTSDPISLHKYLYTNADPTNVRDPSGHDGLAEALVTIGIGLNLAAIDLSLINGIRHTVQHWVSSSGVGGYDITRQLENLRADALKGWQTQTSFTQQALDLSYLTLSSPSNFWRAWDINELYSNRDLISPPGIASPGTVTVGGDVFWDDEVNYYWWGVITRLKDLHNAVGGVAPNTLNDATDTISEYRAAAWGGTDDAPRVAWAKAGYYGSLSYAGDTPLSHYTPGTQYPGFISAYFGEHDGPNTFIAVGSPF